MTVPEAFALGLQHHQAGRLAEAEAIYRQILAVEPRHVDALHLLGVLAHQVGRSDLAVEWIGQALALAPNSPLGHSNLGEAYRKLGRLDDAMAAYRRAIQIEPAYADAHNNLGVALRGLGRVDEAIVAYRKAIEIRSEWADPLNNLGNALMSQGHLDSAIAAFRQALAITPDSAQTCSNLGSALRERGQLDEAVAECVRALQLKPDFAPAHCNLGNALGDRGQPDDAIAAYRRAIQCEPDFAQAHNNLGAALNEQARLDEAIVVFQRAIQIDPNYAEAHSNLGNALKDEARCDEAMEHFRRAVALKREDAALHSNLVYAAIFHPRCDDRALREESARWEQRHGMPPRGNIRPHTNDPNPERRLRVGYVAPDFRRHVICHFLVPLLEAHEHAGVEIYCYSSVKRADKITERIRNTADVWRHVTGVRDEALAALIRADGIDLLVDLTQHMAHNRLLVFARKPAPVQVAWVGYPGSTGLAAMDYRLTDGWMEPEGAAWSESVDQPVRLPDSWFCYDPIDEFPLPGELPALRTGQVTFGCLNNFCKVNDGVLQRWAGVLRAVEGSRLLLQCPEGETRGRVRGFMESLGIAADRVELVGRLPRAEFLGLFERMDIALDPFPYNGGTTTCEALWMGIPVLTLPGEVIVSRIGLSILSACGLPEFVADIEEEYVKLAVSLATDLPRLAQWRATLRGRMKASPFMDAPRFARNVESACRQMWRAWCARQCSTSPS